MEGTLTLGQSRVRLSFNPTSNIMVDEIKRKTAELIDLCDEMAIKKSTVDVHESDRLWSLAMERYEDAAMWAVKAATG